MIIPSPVVPAGRQRARSAGRPLPLARPAAVPPVPEDVVYGIGRIDASGRIADRAVTSALGWSGGDRLTLTANAGVVTARREPTCDGGTGLQVLLSRSSAHKTSTRRRARANRTCTWSLFSWRLCW